MNQVRVIISWAATGHVCDSNGKRVEGGNAAANTFESAELARNFCNSVLQRRPFLECSIQSLNGSHIETLNFETGWNHAFRIEPNGKFRVRLTEWLSRANVTENGEYLGADDTIPLHEFQTYRQAKRYCKNIRTNHPEIAPWIYGPDGNIMFCSERDVTVGKSGERLEFLSWWQSLLRKLKIGV